MADLASIAAKINHGTGVAARILGQVVTRYRAANPLSPFDNSAQTITLNAALDADPLLTMTKPALIGHPTFYLLADKTTLAVGDYLLGNQGKFFVASTEPLRPPLVVLTNAVLSLMRPLNAVMAGLGAPGGDSLAAEVPVLEGWPASVLASGKRAQGDVNLPGDVGMSGWDILLPALFGIEIRGSDILVDATGLRRVVVSAELNETGWRIAAVQEAT